MDTEELRELDTWIGVNLFGFQPVSIDTTTKSTIESRTRKQFVKEWIYFSATLPLYSTDETAAMSVLEHCVSRTQNTVCIGSSSGHKWEVFLGGQYPKTMAGAKTLPQAICLFAKKLFKESKS